MLSTTDTAMNQLNSRLIGLSIAADVTLRLLVATARGRME